MAQERQIEVELRLGRSAELVPALEALVREHPLRERLRGQLMTALYRSGRQAEALETYRDLRRRLAEELGLDPGPAVQELERAILRHEPELRGSTEALAAVPADPGTQRAVLAYAREPARLDVLLAIGEPLVARPGRELILVSVAPEAGVLSHATELSTPGGRHLPSGVSTSGRQRSRHPIRAAMSCGSPRATAPISS